MKPTFYMNPEAEADVRKLRQAITEARGLLSDTAEKLRDVLGDEFFMAETPLEVQAVMESAVASPAKRGPLSWPSTPIGFRRWTGFSGCNHAANAGGASALAPRRSTIGNGSAGD